MTRVTSCRPLTFSCFETMHEVEFQFETKTSNTLISLDGSFAIQLLLPCKKKRHSPMSQKALVQFFLRNGPQILVELSFVHTSITRKVVSNLVLVDVLVVRNHLV